MIKEHKNHIININISVAKLINIKEADRYLVMLPKRATMRDREQRDVLLSAVSVHGILDVDADSARALVQDRKLRFMIK